MMEQLQDYYSRSMSEVSEKRVFPRDYCANRAFLQKGNLRMQRSLKNSVSSNWGICTHVPNFQVKIE